MHVLGVGAVCVCVWVCVCVCVCVCFEGGGGGGLLNAILWVTFHLLLFLPLRTTQVTTLVLLPLRTRQSLNGCTLKNKTQPWWFYP